MTTPRALRYRSPRRAGAVLLPLTVAEREELRAASAREAMTLAGWVRRVALLAARLRVSSSPV
jgi:hypothetical protein